MQSSPRTAMRDSRSVNWGRSFCSLDLFDNSTARGTPSAKRARIHHSEEVFGAFRPVTGTNSWPRPTEGSSGHGTSGHASRFPELFIMSGPAATTAERVFGDGASVHSIRSTTPRLVEHLVENAPRLTIPRRFSRTSTPLRARTLGRLGRPRDPRSMARAGTTERIFARRDDRCG